VPSVPTPSPIAQIVSLEGPYQSARDFSTCLDIGNYDPRPTVTLEFDLVPQRSNIDGVVMLADSSVRSPSRWKDFGVLIRMNSDGHFDARNGSSYSFSSEEPVPYVAGAIYHVKVVVEFGLVRRYDVFVSTSSNGEEIQIADNFSFRHDSKRMQDVGKVCMRSIHGNDLYRLLNLSAY